LRVKTTMCWLKGGHTLSMTGRAQRSSHYCPAALLTLLLLPVAVAAVVAWAAVVLVVVVVVCLPPVCRVEVGCLLTPRWRWKCGRLRRVWEMAAGVGQETARRGSGSRCYPTRGTHACRHQELCPPSDAVVGVGACGSTACLFG
jgi:hypothetical protein